MTAGNGLAEPYDRVPWQRSLRSKLVVAAILVEAVMLSLLLANSYRLVGNALESQTRVRMESLNPLLNASLAGRVFQRDHAEVQAILDQLVTSELTEIPYIVVHDRHEQVLAFAGRVDPARLPAADTDVKSAFADLVYDTQIDLTLLDNQVGSVHFGLALDNMVSLRDRVLQQSLVIATLEILFSLLLLASAGYLLTRHIGGLLAATRSVARGEYGTAIEFGSRDEIGLLAANFNAMAATIRDRIDALSASESWFRTIYDSVGDAIFIHDAESGRLVSVNQRMCEMYGCSREQALASSIHDFSAGIEPYTEERAKQIIQEVRDSGADRTFEWWSRRFDGGLFWVEVNTRFTCIGGEERLVAMMRDISERRRADTEQRLAATSFETNECIIITDPQGRIMRVNRAFTRITGYRPEEAVGKNPRLLKSDRQDAAFYQRLWRQLLETGQWRGEVWNRRKNGEVYPEWLSISAVRDTRGQITHFVGASADLSELKAQQRQNEIRSEEERVLGALLRLSLRQLAIQDYLQQALEHLLGSVPWLGEQQQGGVFLCPQDDPEVLHLVAQHMFPESQQSSCARVAFGTCLCGRTAAARTLQFAEQIDDRHEIRYDDIHPHGHYTVPILSGERLLGVMVLYLKAGHQRTRAEEDFLGRVADALGMGISRRLAEAEIEYQAYHDPLTSLPNRRLMLERLKQELALALRLRLYGALLFIDLDHFKSVNDMYGHPIGDALLSEVAERLGKRLRSGDTAARLGGDEFVVLLPALGKDAESAARQAQTVADSLRRALAGPYPLHGVDYPCSASIGIVVFPEQDDDCDDLLRHADTAMYSAKRAGRDTVQFYRPEMQEAVERRLLLELDLRRAIAERQFLLHYQPQVSVASDGIIGAEALVRWRHPQRGMVPPDQFVPLADETGQILAIGDWVLETAIRQTAEWRAAGCCGEDFSVAVNVSPRQFRDAGFVDRVLEVLARHGLPSRHLKLEITEGIVINDVEEAIAKMQLLRGQGVRFSMDDFGTGYSSLSYLKRLPLDQLKIDRSFVRDLLRDSSDATIVTTIIHMARDLSMEVVAEGVEDYLELEFLCRHHCDRYQGYLFSRPLPSDEMTELLCQQG